MQSGCTANRYDTVLKERGDIRLVHSHVQERECVRLGIKEMAISRIGGTKRAKKWLKNPPGQSCIRDGQGGKSKGSENGRFPSDALIVCLPL